MRIYNHQFGIYSDNSRRYNSTGYRNNQNGIRDDVFYDGDIKPVIKLRKTGGRWKARIVGHKRVKKPWLQRNYKPLERHADEFIIC